ncbi:DNA-processing protein DprA [Leptolyngbya sp. NIES-2104]|uniref:DNA-processing protein DprA n=1 Tax=Leptolyngbya sp. NIES-2104 TaxID=1552121 RepID=UPI0006EC4AF7|nr:DNA-processing protein DprA [Leptolyngbya sp. NIES-2104]GAP98543.1 Rossmann fold nucleotide-binding protein Smf [Leptolyngbya sp. NIES-2104]
MSDDRAFWLAWSKIPGVGAILQKRIHAELGSLKAAWTVTPEELAIVEGIGQQSAIAICQHRDKLNVDRVFKDHESQNFLTPADSDYPQLFAEIPDPPPVLYYRGRVELLRDLDRQSAVAIVGTREPSDYGRRWTRKLSTTLAQHGFTVMSGLADGIDAEAHRSCLDVGGNTIAVLGTGVDLVYPAKNRCLYQQLLETGLALSEYPAGTQPDRTHFPRRNRIVAALSRAVLVIEAPTKSGALITATLANEYGRDVYALPGSLDNPRSAGCLDLISKGAQMILGESELMAHLGTIPELDQANQLSIPTIDLAPELATVLEAIYEIAQQSNHPSAPFDLIVQTAEMPTAAVSSSLMQLELLGLVTQVPGMRYQIQ